MDPISLLAILVLAGAIVVLIYYYLVNSSNVDMSTYKAQVHGLGDYIGGNESVHVASEKVSDMGDKIRGKVKDVPINTDVLSSRIDAFLDEKSDELIKDWELATKNDVTSLDERMQANTQQIGNLEKRFNEYCDYTNEKLDSFDERLKKLEEVE
jgi:hypothetical protein